MLITFDWLNAKKPIEKRTTKRRKPSRIPYGSFRRAYNETANYEFRWKQESMGRGRKERRKEGRKEGGGKEGKKERIKEGRKEGREERKIEERKKEREKKGKRKEEPVAQRQDMVSGTLALL